MSNLKGRGGLWLRTGKIVHLYRKIGVAVVELERPLARGTPIYIHGATTSYEQVATSMEIDHQQVEKATIGQKIGLKLARWARKKDVVFQWVEGSIYVQKVCTALPKLSQPLFTEGDEIIDPVTVIPKPVASDGGAADAEDQTPITLKGTDNPLAWMQVNEQLEKGGMAPEVFAIFGSKRLLHPDELELEQARWIIKRQQRRIAALKLQTMVLPKVEQTEVV
jgi:hypothetical protein